MATQNSNEVRSSQVNLNVANEESNKLKANIKKKHSFAKYLTKPSEIDKNKGDVATNTNDDDKNQFIEEVRPFSPVHSRIDNYVQSSTVQDFLMNASINDAVLKPAPLNQTIKCRIRRLRESVTVRFVFYLEMTNDRIVPIMFTNSKFLKILIYSVNDDDDDYTDENLDYKNKSSRRLIGELSANFRRNKFMAKHLLDQQALLNIFDTEDAGKQTGLNSLKISNENRKFKNLTQRPLDMHIAMNNEKEIEMHEDDKNESLKFITKEPIFVESINAYCLDFKGRVLKSSRNNAQIVNEMNDTNVLLQIGKYTQNVYTCDYSYPFSAFQAFSIALSILT